MEPKGDSIANGNSFANGPGAPAWLRYDPLFAEIHAARESIWKHLEP